VRRDTTLIGYVICVGLGIMAAILVLAVSTWTTLLIGLAVMLVITGVLALVRKRTG
jgi:hypothetical protein